MSEENKLAPLFTSAEDWKCNACLNWSDDPLEICTLAYKEAAEELANRLINDNFHIDALIFQICFLYRQYVELRLKEIIRSGRQLIDELGEFPKHHKIESLWETAKVIIVKAIDSDLSEVIPDLKLIEHVVSEFVKYDPESFSFRYPTDKKGNNPLKGIKHINVRHLAEYMKKFSDAMDNASFVISVYIDHKFEMATYD